MHLTEALQMPLPHPVCLPLTLLHVYSVTAEHDLSLSLPLWRGIGRLRSIPGLSSTMPHGMVETPHRMDEMHRGVDCSCLAASHNSINPEMT